METTKKGEVYLYCHIAKANYYIWDYEHHTIWNITQHRDVTEEMEDLMEILELVSVLKLVKATRDSVLYSDGKFTWDSVSKELTRNKAKGTLAHYLNAHYACTGLKQQPIEIMRTLMTKDMFIGFLWGNVLKYALRYGHKDACAKEAHKMANYAHWLEQVLNGDDKLDLD